MTANKPVYLLDETLEVSIFYETKDKDLEDNICMVISEDCPEDEKIFKHDESYLYLTREQAEGLAQALLHAVEKSKSAASKP